MSEKHLTELPWKTLAIKQGVKDLGLGKALAAYANVDATKEPAKALEGLLQIAELAVKLKKANPKNEDVVAHLDEVVKEVKKNTPNLEARVKSATAAVATEVGAASSKGPTVAPGKPVAVEAKLAAAKPNEDEEEEAAAAFKKDLKQQMVSALAQVKARAPGGPEQQKEPKPQLQFIACLAGKNCAVIVARVVGAATKKLLLDIAKVDSGGKFVQGECIFEKNSHTFVLEEVPGGLAKKLAMALQTETGQKYKVRVRNTDGSVSLDSDTDVDPEAAATTTAGSRPAVSGDEMAKFKQRLVGLLPRIKASPQVKANAGTKDEKGLNVLASEAGYFAKNQDFAKANQLLDQVESLLEPGGSSAGEFPKQWVAAKQAWQIASDNLDAQLAQLQQALRQSGDAELQDIAEFGLNGLTGNFKVPLMKAILEIDSASGDALKNASANARAIITGFRQHIDSDEKVEACDENPFGVNVTVRQTIGGGLDKLEQALAAAA